MPKAGRRKGPPRRKPGFKFYHRQSREHTMETILAEVKDQQEQSEILFQNKSNMVSNWACAYILADTTIPLDEWLGIRKSYGEITDEEIELVLDGPRCVNCAGIGEDCWCG